MDIPFPILGLDRSTAFRAQPPYSTPDCLNVRPDSDSDQRMRGGSRPGLSKAYSQLLGAGGPVRMLGSVRSVIQEGVAASWSDLFNSGVTVNLTDPWEVAPWIVGDQIMRKAAGKVFRELAGGINRSAIRSVLDGFDPTRPYTIDLFLLPDLDIAGGYRGVVEVFFALDNAAPDWTDDGCMLRLTHGDDDDYESILSVNNGGVNELISGSSGTSTTAAGHLIITVDDLDVTVMWQGVTIVSTTVTTMPPGTRIGFRFAGTEPSGYQYATSIAISYQSLTAIFANRQILTASAGGLFYREDFANPSQLVQVVAGFTTPPFRDDVPFAAVERAGKQYLADWTTKSVASDGVIASGNQLTSAAIVDFTDLGGGEETNPETDVVVIFDATGPTEGAYEIASVTASTITLATSPGNGTASFRIEQAVKVYDPSQDEIDILVATAGSVPQGNKAAALYRDRLVLAGSEHSPHAWFMSRQGDPRDWDYGAPSGDVRRAVAGTVADAGEIAEPVRALIPFSDDYLIFACMNSSWILRGDPAYGGQVDNLSYKIGCIGPFAWCHGPDGEIISLSRDGIYALPPGAGAVWQPISRPRLPREMISIDIANNQVQLAYDLIHRGVIICITPNDLNEDGRHFWFDWDTKSFYPEQYAGFRNPTRTFAYDSDDPTRSAVLLGGRDGYIYKHTAGVGDDDGDEFTSYVMIGPFRTAGNDELVGTIQWLCAVLGTNSAAVNWSLHATFDDEHAVEYAMAGTAVASGTWDIAGINFKVYPRIRHSSFVLKLTNADSAPWAMERITMAIKQSGKMRLR